MSERTLTLLGFDFGERRIGIAVGQTVTGTASPLTTLQVKNDEHDWQAIDKIIADWRPNALVVGRPVKMDGSEQTITLRSDMFADWLSARYQLPVYRVDERLTSAAAKDYLIDKMQTTKKIKPQLDPVSAKIILEIWLDQHQHEK